MNKTIFRSGPSFRSYAKALLVAAIALLFNHSELSSQDKNEALEKSISDLVKTLESTGDDSRMGVMAVMIARQIRLAYDTGDSNQLQTARSYLNSSSSLEHKKQFSEILQRVEKELSKRTEKLQKKWLEKINAFARDTEKACLKNAPIGEMVKLLIASDAISSKRPSTANSSAPLIREAISKFSSASQVLQGWISYKRFEEKGYSRQAVDRLKNLARSSPAFPILDKAFLDKKIAILEKDLKPENTTQRNSKTLNQEQLDIINKLNDSKLEVGIFLAAADQLEAFPESHSLRVTIGTQLNEAISSLAECLLAQKTGTTSLARYYLSLFSEYASGIPQLDALRKRATFELTPNLFAEIEPKPPRPNQSVQSYLLQLISSPKSGKEIKARQQLLDLYRRNIPNSSQRASWTNAADNQYFALINANSAMNAEDYKNALKNFRQALTHAPGSGPAEAVDLIEANIKKILELEPAISDPSISDLLERLQAIESKLNKMQIQSARYQ